MESVFEECNVYTLKKELQLRDATLKNILNNARLQIIAITGTHWSGETSLFTLT